MTADGPQPCEYTVLIRMVVHGSKQDIAHSCEAVDDELDRRMSGQPELLYWDLGVAMAGDRQAEVEVGLTVMADSTEHACMIGSRWLHTAMRAGRHVQWHEGICSAAIREGGL